MKNAQVDFRFLSVTSAVQRLRFSGFAASGAPERSIDTLGATFPVRGQVLPGEHAFLATYMYAEAENELNGPTNEAYNFLNQVRDRAGASLYTPGSHTKEELRDLIIQERYWELSFEFHEVFDLRRFGLVEDAINQNFEAQLKGTVYRPDFELWPIPTKEIDANPNLQQNPGW